MNTRRRPAHAPRPLDEEEWRAVFRLRCRSKRGETLSDKELARCRAAHAEDPARYAAMTEKVNLETAPFGSTLWWKNTP